MFQDPQGGAEGFFQTLPGALGGAERLVEILQAFRGGFLQSLVVGLMDVSGLMGGAKGFFSNPSGPLGGFQKLKSFRPFGVCFFSKCVRGADGCFRAHRVGLKDFFKFFRPHWVGLKN